jgi:hypothetical protein
MTSEVTFETHTEKTKEDIRDVTSATIGDVTVTKSVGSSNVPAFRISGKTGEIISTEGGIAVLHDNNTDKKNYTGLEQKLGLETVSQISEIMKDHKFTPQEANLAENLVITAIVQANLQKSKGTGGNSLH